MMDDIPLGPTGRYPYGKISEDDQGELRCAITAKKGQVVLLFGKEVAWLSLPPDAARELANVLIHKACAIDGKPFVLGFTKHGRHRP